MGMGGVGWREVDFPPRKQTFQNSIPVPMKLENRMTIEVSLLMRYRRIMSWQKALMTTLR